MTGDIIEALALHGHWHGDHSPLGTTGDYALDIKLADAFRMMLYLEDVKARLDWIQREVTAPRRQPPDHRYHADLCAWWLDLWDAEKAPIIENRMQQRGLLQCVS